MPPTNRVILAALLSLLTALGVLAAPGVSAAPAPAPAAAAARGDDGHRWLTHLASLNIQHSYHRPQGPARARRLAEEVKRQGAKVVSFQEVEKDQLAPLMNTMPGFSFWPRHTLETRDYLLQIAWRRDLYEKTRQGRIYRMFGKHSRAVPYVQLRNRRSGQRFWVIDIHNSWGRLESQRDSATKKEIELVKRLRSTGLPVLIGADTNERIEFCSKMARATDLVSANGGTESNPCPTPPGFGPDRIMGGSTWLTDLRRFQRIRNTVIRNNTDHPLLLSRVYARERCCR